MPASGINCLLCTFLPRGIPPGNWNLGVKGAARAILKLPGYLGDLPVAVLVLKAVVTCHSKQDQEAKNHKGASWHSKHQTPLGSTAVYSHGRHWTLSLSGLCPILECLRSISSFTTNSDLGMQHDDPRHHGWISATHKRKPEFLTCSPSLG